MPVPPQTDWGPGYCGTFSSFLLYELVSKSCAMLLRLHWQVQLDHGFLRISLTSVNGTTCWVCLVSWSSLEHTHDLWLLFSQGGLGPNIQNRWYGTMVLSYDPASSIIAASRGSTRELASAAKCMISAPATLSIAQKETGSRACRSSFCWQQRSWGGDFGGLCPAYSAWRTSQAKCCSWQQLVWSSLSASCRP